MNAAIFGGGIGGLTTAIALRSIGIDCTVYEKASTISEVGAGISLAPNALGILERLGLMGAITKVGYPLSHAGVVDLRRKELQTIDVDMLREKFGYGLLMFHRADLQRLLLEALPESMVRTGAGLKEILWSGGERGKGKGSALLTNGEKVEADLVVCADGIHSAGRRSILGERPLRYSGQTGWRFITHLPDALSSPWSMQEIFGDGNGLRSGFFPLASGDTYVYLTQKTPAGGTDNLKSVQSDLRTVFASFPPIIAELIDSVDPASIIRTDLYDLPKLPRWSLGTVTLLGDAAHATTPNLGQGACQAIESAAALANALGNKSEIPSALAAYEAIRKPKATFIMQTSRRLAQLSNASGPMARVAHAVLKGTPGWMMERQYRRIYTPLV